MNASGLIINGEVVPCSMPVYNWHDTGKEIKIGKGARRHQPKQVVDLAVWHWTGGEGNLAQLHRVLEARGYGVEFYVAEGKIFQLADPLKTDAFGAGTYNPRSVSIEVQNYGFTMPGRPVPKNARGVRPMIDVVQGGRKRRFASFWKEDLDACTALAHALSNAIPTIPAQVYVDADGKPYPNFIPPAKMAGLTGHVGHYQLSKMKSDPGPELLQRLVESGVCRGVLLR
jgi:hypothetical protein